MGIGIRRTGRSRENSSHPDGSSAQGLTAESSERCSARRGGRGLVVGGRAARGGDERLSAGLAGGLRVPAPQWRQAQHRGQERPPAPARRHGCARREVGSTGRGAGRAPRGQRLRTPPPAAKETSPSLFSLLWVLWGPSLANRVSWRLVDPEGQTPPAGGAALFVQSLTDQNRALS